MDPTVVDATAFGAILLDVAAVGSTLFLPLCQVKLSLKPLLFSFRCH